MYYFVDNCLQNSFFYPFMTYPTVFLPYSNQCHQTQRFNSNVRIQNNLILTSQQKKSSQKRTENFDQQLQDYQFLPQEKKISTDNSFQSKKIGSKKRKNYATKNTQANILNQNFSFMGCEKKSRHLVERILSFDEKKITTFYTMMKLVKRHLRKYINRIFLKQMFTMGKSNNIYKLLSKGVKRLEILSIEEFKKTIRVLTAHYFKQQLIQHLLSSCRLSKSTLKEHIKRRREIMAYLYSSQRL